MIRILSLLYITALIHEAPAEDHKKGTNHQTDPPVRLKEEGHVMVVVPEELVYFVRQYNARIRMPYGREMIEGQWDYYNEVHEAMEETEEDIEIEE